MISRTSWGRRILMSNTMLLLTCTTSLAQIADLVEKDQPIPAILQKIQDQTHCGILYQYDIFKDAPPVTIALKGITADRALRDCLAGLEYDCNKRGNVFTISRRVPFGVSIYSPFTGRVINTDGAPIARASVMIRGTNNKGVMTEADGSFSIPATGHTVSVQITCLGYVERSVELDNKDNMRSFTLQTNSVPIDEVIVRAYGATTTKLNTGSSSPIKAAILDEQPVMNTAAALSGRAPGIVIDQLSGNPGAGFNIQIRGQSSVDNAKPPLTIVDEMILSDGITSAIGSGSPKGQTGANMLNTISPGIIDNIEVLKDAAATSIYGSRGANGVLLITTKKGAPGRLQLTASSYAGFERAIRTGRLMNTSQYLSLRRQAVLNDGFTPDAYTIPESAWDTSVSRDFKKILTGGAGIVNDHSLSLSGGNTNHLLFLNASYHRQSSVVPGNQFDRRLAAFTNYGYISVDRKFHLQVSGNYSYEANHLPVLDLSNYTLLAPHTPYPATNDNNYSWRQNDVSFVNLKAIQLNEYNAGHNSWFLHGEAGYQVLPRLNIKVSYGQLSGALEEQSWMPKAGQDPQLSYPGYYYWSRNKYSSWMGETIANYSLPLKKYGKLDLLAGAMRQQEIKEYMGFTIQNYEDMQPSPGGNPANTQISLNRVIYRYEAFMGRLEYNFSDKYIVTFSGRSDASSRFGPDKRHALFGAVGAAWIFIDDTIVSWPHWLSFGKIRVSYGTTGNDQIGDYKFASLYSATAAGNPYQGIQGLVPTSFYNPSLSWEINHESELGFDVGVWNNRFTLSMACYHNWTGNELVQESLASQAGLPGEPVNRKVIIVNEGLEGRLRTVNFSTRSFCWSSTFSLTRPRNTLKSFPGLKTSTYKNLYTEGRSLTDQLGYGYLGIDPHAGLYTFLDKDHNDTLDSRDYISGGNLDLRCYGGLDNTFSYKDWAWGFFFEFRQRNGLDPLISMLNQNLPGMPGNYSQGNFPIQFLDYWHNPGDHARFQRVTADPASHAAELAYDLPSSSARVHDASFIRLKNFWISRKLSQNMLRKYHMKDGAVSLRAENILTLTHFPFTDPETQDPNALPPVKTFTLGLQITF